VCVLDATRLRRRWWGTPSPVNACSGGGGGDDDDAGVKIRRPPPPPPPYVYVSDVTTGGLLAPLPRRPRSSRNTAKRRRRRLPPPTPPTAPFDVHAHASSSVTLRHNITSCCRSAVVYTPCAREFHVRIQCARAPAFPVWLDFFPSALFFA